MLPRGRIPESAATPTLGVKGPIGNRLAQVEGAPPFRPEAAMKRFVFGVLAVGTLMFLYVLHPVVGVAALVTAFTYTYSSRRSFRRGVGVHEP